MERSVMHRDELVEGPAARPTIRAPDAVQRM